MRRRAVLIQLTVLWTLTGTVTALSQDDSLQGVTGYRMTVVRNGTSGLKRQFTQEQLALLEKLNRSDLAHLGRQQRIVVPDAWVADELAYAMLPARYPSSEHLPKLLITHQPTQVFGAYERGELVRWGPVSSGARRSPTPSGLFSLNWRKKDHISSVDPEWKMPWTFNFESFLGLAFHEYALPGRPASHSCVRLLERDARWLFEWGEPWTESEGAILETGTPVFIVGQYNFDAPPPWRPVNGRLSPVQLPELPMSITRPVSEDSTS